MCKDKGWDFTVERNSRFDPLQIESVPRVCIYV